MRVLLTNDDGVEAEGLRALARAVGDEGHDAVIVAPLEDVSGNGTSLGTFVDGTVIKSGAVGLDGLEDVATFWVEGPPSFAVLAACLGRFGTPPDVVISGINPGWNTGRFLLFSSTVGAALTASMMGRPALAISCGDLPNSRFESAALIARSALSWLIDRKEPSTVLNINVPDVPPGAERGVRSAPLGKVSTAGLDLAACDGGLRLSRFTDIERASDPRFADTDAGLVMAGYITVTGLTGGARELPAGQLDGIVEAMNKGVSRHEDARW